MSGRALLRSVAPLLLAWFTVVVPIHSGVGTISKEVLRFRAGSHLRAHRAAVAMEGGGCIRSRSRLYVGKYGGRRSETRITVNADRGNGQQRHDHFDNPARLIRTSFCPRTTACLVLSRTHHADGPQLAVWPRFRLEGYELVEPGTHAVAWEGGNMDENLFPALGGEDEAEPTVIVPCGQGAVSSHQKGPRSELRRPALDWHRTRYYPATTEVGEPYADWLE